ncbi:MAG: helix-turn-helix transcriptional regulator [Deltaproteobacteria bacterium]|nr:helix-turn-helix transcriptional regulator [Deltaproteobacteria bacterium]
MRVETVAHVTGIKLGRLRAIEDGADPTVLELEQLAETYGVDVETLWEMPISLSPGDGVTVLTSVDEFRDVDDVTRVRILRAATAARDLVTLRRRSGDPLPAPNLADAEPPGQPVSSGRWPRGRLRVHLG